MHQRKSRPGAWVYIMSNRSQRIYTGSTNQLLRRVREHKERRSGYTQRYKFDRLVYYEPHSDMRAAEARERQVKAWTRAKRVALVQKDNPNWLDLTPDVTALLMG